jgi:DNA repair protein RadC
VGRLSDLPDLSFTYKLNAIKKETFRSTKGDWTVAELSVTYNTQKGSKKRIKSVVSCHSIIKSLWNMELINLQEEFLVLFINSSSKTIGYRTLNKGSMEQCPVDIKLLVSMALHCMASAVVIAHNHPSGNVMPSDSDKALTKRIKRALNIVDIRLLDHFIISKKSYYSFAQRKLL